MGLVGVLVDCNREVEVVDQEHSRKDLEQVYSQRLFFLLPILPILPILTIFIFLHFLLDWLFFAGLIRVPEVFEFGCLFGNFTDGYFLDGELQLALFSVGHTEDEASLCLFS